MRFIVDECTGPSVAEWLRSLNHTVFSVYDEAKGMDDERIIDKAHRENYIIITNDKDFGELVYRSRKKHNGIVLLRLEDERPENKISILKHLLESYADYLANSFVIVTQTTVRIIK